jgi:hypothetical protein
MLTFLEFYQSMLGFINYKLYTDAHLHYPPQLNAQLDDQGAGLIASYVIQSTQNVLPIESVDRTDAEQKVPYIMQCRSWLIHVGTGRACNGENSDAHFGPPEH